MARLTLQVVKMMCTRWNLQAPSAWGLMNSFPMENLDYVLQRMEERTPDNFHLSAPGEGFQHGSRARSSTFSTRTLLDSYRDKPKERCSCCTCKVMAALVIIALLAWGIAVPVYFLIGPGSAIRSENQARMSVVAAQRSPGNRSFLNGTGITIVSKIGQKEDQTIGGSVLVVIRKDPYGCAMRGTTEMSSGLERKDLEFLAEILNAINGTIRIVNQRFTPSLANHFSAEYQALKLKLETLLSVVFNKKSEFNKAAVIGFRPGSVVVQFVLIFNKNQLLVRHLVQTTLTRYLGSHWSMLGTFQVDIASIEIRNVRNQCAVDNGGCSHLCFWSVLSAGYECRCPQDYRLLNDGKSCFPEKMPKATTTANPCADDQFLCRSRNCIPNRWLCDGVSDCLLGEDEASHLCQTPLKRHVSEVNSTTVHKSPLRQTSINERYKQPAHKPPPAASYNSEQTTIVKAKLPSRLPEVVPTTARPSPPPVVLLQRRPVEVIADMNPPSLAAQDKKDEDPKGPRSFSFFG